MFCQLEDTPTVSERETICPKCANKACDYHPEYVDIPEDAYEADWEGEDLEGPNQVVCSAPHTIHSSSRRCMLHDPGCPF